MSDVSMTDTSYYVNQMRNWLDRQSHLPKDFDDRMLYRFAHSCYFDLEKAKVALEKFVSIRGCTPEFVIDRDPDSRVMKKSISLVYSAKYNISNNRYLWVWQINDPGFDNYNYVMDAKLFTFVTDIFLLTDYHVADGDIVMLDVKDVNYKFMTTFNVSICRKLLKYQQEALPIRLKQVHVVNAPSVTEMIFSAMKPFLSKEVIEMVHIHVPSSDGLYDYFKKDDLPSDYGGNLPSVKEVNVEAYKKVSAIRDILLRTDLWTPIGNKDNDISMDNGCFRSLNLD